MRTYQNSDDNQAPWRLVRSRRTPHSQVDLVATERGRLGPWARNDTLAIVALLVVGSLLPLSLSLLSGSFSIPHNDDWGYRRIALTLFHDHRIALLGWNQMTLVGQILSVQPLLALARGANWAFGAYGVISGAIALVATYCLSRRFLPTGRAMLATSALLVAPGFLVSEPTFMTDVPSVAISMVALAVAAYAFDREGATQTFFLVVALLVGTFGFSIREFGIAAPLAILTVALLRAPSKWRSRCALLASFLLLCVAIMILTVKLPGPHEPLQPVVTPTTIRAALKLASDIALAVLAPAVFCLLGTRRRLVTGLSVLGVVAIGAIVLPRVHNPLAGNLLTQQGVAGDALLAGARPNLFSAPIWNMIGSLALVGEICLAAIVLSRAAPLLPSDRLARFHRMLCRPEAMLYVLIVYYSGGLIIATGAGAFDRYVWPLVGPLGIVLVMGARGFRPAGLHHLARVAAGTIVVLLFCVELALAMNSFAYDNARWSAGTTLRATPLASDAIDAGYEWFGYHQSGPVRPGSTPGSTLYAWYEQIYGTPFICGLVSASPLQLSNLRLDGVTTYRLLELFGPKESLYRYLVHDSHCP